MTAWPEPAEGWKSISAAEVVTALDLEVVTPRGNRSWAPIDLGPYVRKEITTPEPTIGRRVDGRGCMYPGTGCTIAGPSGIGKSLLTNYIMAEALAEGDTVVILDYEDTAATTTERLRLFGVSDDAILNRVKYLNPTPPVDLEVFEAEVLVHNPTLMFLDAVTAAQAQDGIEANDAVAVTAWYDRLIRPLNRRGITTVLVDHAGKDIERGVRGSSAKRDMISGTLLFCIERAVIAPGHRGVLSLEVHKDRPGRVRASTLDGHRFGDFIVDATGDSFEAYIEPPQANARALQRERVAAAIARLDPTPNRPVSTGDVQEATGSKDASGKVLSPYVPMRTVQLHLDALHDAGELGRRQQGRGFVWWLT